jgi:MFS family permease
MTLSSLAERRVGWLAAAVAVNFFGFAGIFYFIMLYAGETNISRPSLWYVVGPAAVVLSRLFGGRLFDRRGPGVAVAAALAMLFAAFTSLAVWRTDAGFLWAAAMQGLAMGLLHPCIMAMAANMVEAERRGAAMATVFAAFDMGIGSGSLVLGWVAGQTGSYAAMFGVAAVTLVVPAALYWLKVLPGYAATCVSGPA